jgi:hypothetical protein
MVEIFEKGMSDYKENKKRYSKRCKERAEIFNWDEAAKAYIEVYRSLIQ